MLKLTVTLALGAFGMLTGCAPMVSLHPLATEDNSAPVDLRYTGLWKDCTGNDTWKVEAKGNRGYTYLQLAKDGDSGQASLVELEETQFADLMPDHSAVSAHLLAKVRLEGDTLYLALLDETAASKALAHEVEGSGGNKQIILTASTADLRNYLLRVRNQPGYFQEETSLCRVK